MKVIFLIGLYSVIAVIFLSGWLMMALAGVLFVSIVGDAFYLVLLALLLDGYLGHFYSWPVLVSVALAWYLVIEYLKPLMREHF